MEEWGVVGVDDEGLMQAAAEAIPMQGLAQPITYQEPTELSSLNYPNTARYGCFGSTDGEIDRDGEEVSCCFQKAPRAKSPEIDQRSLPAARGGRPSFDVVLTAAVGKQVSAVDVELPLPRVALDAEDIASRQWNCYLELTKGRLVGKPDEALKLFTSLRKVGVPPSKICYKVLMQDLGNAGRYAEIVDLLDNMTLDGYPPSGEMYRTAIQLLLDGNATDLALAVATDAESALSTTADELGPSLWRTLFVSLLRGGNSHGVGGGAAGGTGAGLATNSPHQLVHSSVVNRSPGTYSRSDPSSPTQSSSSNSIFPSHPSGVSAGGRATMELEPYSIEAAEKLLASARKCIREGGIITVEEQLELTLRMVAARLPIPSCQTLFDGFLSDGEEASKYLRAAGTLSGGTTDSQLLHLLAAVCNHLIPLLCQSSEYDAEESSRTHHHHKGQSSHQSSENGVFPSTTTPQSGVPQLLRRPLTPGEVRALCGKVLDMASHLNVPLGTAAYTALLIFEEKEASRLLGDSDGALMVQEEEREKDHRLASKKSGAQLEPNHQHPATTSVTIQFCVAQGMTWMKRLLGGVTHLSSGSIPPQVLIIGARLAALDIPTALKALHLAPHLTSSSAHATTTATAGAGADLSDDEGALSGYFLQLYRQNQRSLRSQITTHLVNCKHDATNAVALQGVETGATLYNNLIRVAYHCNDLLGVAYLLHEAVSCQPGMGSGGAGAVSGAAASKDPFGAAQNPRWTPVIQFAALALSTLCNAPASLEKIVAKSKTTTDPTGWLAHLKESIQLVRSCDREILKAVLFHGQTTESDTLQRILSQSSSSGFWKGINPLLASNLPGPGAEIGGGGSGGVGRSSGGGGAGASRAAASAGKLSGPSSPTTATSTTTTTTEQDIVALGAEVHQPIPTMPIAQAIGDMVSTEGKPAEFYINLVNGGLLRMLADWGATTSSSASGGNNAASTDSAAAQSLIAMMRRYDTTAGGAFLIPLDSIVSLLPSPFAATNNGVAGPKGTTTILPSSAVTGAPTRKERKACFDLVKRWIKRYRWVHLLPLSLTFELVVLGSTLKSISTLQSNLTALCPTTGALYKTMHMHTTTPQQASLLSRDVMSTVVTAAVLRLHHKRLVLLLGDDAASGQLKESLLAATELGAKPVLQLKELLARLNAAPAPQTQPTAGQGTAAPK